MKSRKSNKPHPTFKTPIHLACSDDYYRQNLMYVHFSEGWAYATDAHIIACCNLRDFGIGDKECSILEGKSIHKTQFAQFYKKFVQIKPEGIRVPEYNCTYEFQDSSEWTNSKGETITQWMINAVNGKFKKEQVDEIGINSTLLKILSQCLGESNVVLNFKTNRHAIKVTPRSNEFTHYGYIMPVALKNHF